LAQLACGVGQIKNITLLKKVATVLKELRVANNLTQGDVYYDTAIHIGRIEAYKVNLSISTLSELCDYFEISLTDFFKKVESV
jgi:transcriptional regulator with XRE-family HTH domain